ncbi:MAG: hypothetical protein K2I33_01310, partial [Oscillospiraceae bacterium]|nr:hypothetical protein [Oscillospiraceae bacterium]
TEDDDYLYGDVNLDGFVNSTDVVVLNKYLISNSKYALQNEKAYEQAQTVYDDSIDSKDTMAIINYVLGVLTLDDLGPGR